ncbi:YggS family pyridoxal phosphate-dependent enzyme [Paenisporosarcina antarctica]|uniref:Pyridoxal phosphate homeostasis protein n=1 Tax=Paenisporosarcina antarctica TaxID=417367 RepID=A0A4P6ZZ15_9BACL|nr:YggS family pyridoxal phosphate-dependent enzyme [Paenisporosarcina antarctica]QBP41534.1 YggS family pyridoxal phosphate-dependent enzyme [Paenisporosarcina antarctica]
MRIDHKLQQIQNQIYQACTRVNRSISDVHIVAVTKSVSIERTEEALQAGLNHLGENRPEGLLTKQAVITTAARWHYIGSLQTRKVKQVINSISVLHSLDRLSLADEIQKRADHTIDCFVQVNVSREEAKHGIELKDVQSFIESLNEHDRIRVIGLMTMAPHTANDEVIRSLFKSLKDMQLKIASNNYPYAPCTELSMGMSNDFEIAIEEGATYVRIGTALVGDESEDVI